jgi:HSP20 family protein
MSIRTLANRPVAFPTVFSDFFEPWEEWFNDDRFRKALTVPKVNISENEKSYDLEVAAPGLHKKDLKIDVKENVLTISAESEKNKEEKNDKYTRQEYNYSSFSRSFTLPEDVAKDKIEANYDGGVLKISLPKNVAPELKPKMSVEVK